MHRVLQLVVILMVSTLPCRADEPERVQIEIGRDTTYFTEPVNDDGTIDYIAALNAQYGEGVTNENNAFALMAQLFPVLDENAEAHEHIYRERLFAKLDIEDCPDTPKFVDWQTFATTHGLSEQAADDMFWEAQSRPWTAVELPLMAAWLDTNQAVLDRFDEALQREHYFTPLVRLAADELAYTVLLPHLSRQRHIARTLTIRGFLAIAEGDEAAVVGDLNRLHRFGELVARGPVMLEVLVGISIQNQQRLLIEAIADRGVFTHTGTLRFVQNDTAHPTINTILGSVSVTERCMFLDVLQCFYAGRGSLLDVIHLWGSDELTPSSEAFYRRLQDMPASPLFDINRSLRQINQRIERQIEISSMKDLRASREADAEFNALLEQEADAGQFLNLMSMCISDDLLEGWTRDRYTDEVTDLYARMMLSSLGAGMRTQNRANARRLVESTAIALLGYRDRHGELPASLEALMPTYFDAVPIDFATGEPLIYRVNDDGSAVVYSIGDNFIDDGGIDDDKTGDIAITIGPGQP